MTLKTSWRWCLTAEGALMSEAPEDLYAWIPGNPCFTKAFKVSAAASFFYVDEDPVVALSMPEGYAEAIGDVDFIEGSPEEIADLVLMHLFGDDPEAVWEIHCLCEWGRGIICK